MNENIDDTVCNDFEKFIGHSEFARVLQLSHSLKQQKISLDWDPSSQLHEHVPSTWVPKQSSSSNMSILKDEDDNVPFDESAAYIRNTLIGPFLEPLKRGTCRITDSLIDETIAILASELRMVLSIKEQMKASSSVENQGTDETMDENEHSNVGKRDTKEDRKRRCSLTKANATKFSKSQTDTLIKWMIDNIDHPYLSKVDIANLTESTGLDEVQITNWVNNARKRNGKAVIENNKKPYHFLDYLFLATDREKHAAEKGKIPLKRDSDDDFNLLNQFSYSVPKENGRHFPGNSPIMSSNVSQQNDIDMEAKTSSTSSGPFDEVAADSA